MFVSPWNVERTPEDLVMQLLVLKLLYLLFTTKGTADYFYVNDLCVLVDVFLREILDLDEDNESVSCPLLPGMICVSDYVSEVTTYLSPSAPSAADEDAAHYQAIQTTADSAHAGDANRAREHPGCRSDNQTARTQVPKRRLVCAATPSKRA